MALKRAPRISREFLCYTRNWLRGRGRENMSFQYLAVIAAIFICFAKAENVLDFVMIGDWGGKPDAPYYTIAEADIATQMGKKASEVGAQFTIALGDNFYDMGVKNVDDPRFKETFEVGLKCELNV